VQRTLRRLKTLTTSSHSEPLFESSRSLLTFTALRATTQHHAHVTNSITITAFNERQSVRVSSGFLRTFQLTLADSGNSSAYLMDCMSSVCMWHWCIIAQCLNGLSWLLCWLVSVVTVITNNSYRYFVLDGGWIHPQKKEAIPRAWTLENFRLLLCHSQTSHQHE